MKTDDILLKKINDKNFDSDLLFTLGFGFKNDFSSIQEMISQFNRSLRLFYIVNTFFKVVL